MKIELLDSAEKDLLDGFKGFKFYERQSMGFGDYFLDPVFSGIKSLRVYAGIHALHFGYHRLLSKRFPFAVSYGIQKDITWVHAILDCRSNPAWIRNRLS